ncbi:MAG TPA: HDOD domain-containing protein [Steroidobacteraceae bacterium]
MQVASFLGLLESAGQGSLASLIMRLGDPTVALNDIVGLIEGQPTLCARVLRVANCAYYGHARSVASIGGAVMLLGLDCVRAIATTSCVFTAMTRQLNEVLPDLGKLAQHSVAAAVAAQLLARIALPGQSAEAFMSGITHDIGFLLLCGVRPRQTGELIRARQADPNRDIRSLEAATVGTGHEECAMILLDEWGFPPSLVAAVGYHHHPESAPREHRKLAALVSVAVELPLLCGYAYSLEPVTASLSLETLGLRELDASEVLSQLPKLAGELEGALTGT